MADELTRPDSKAVMGLRRSVQQRFGERVSGEAVLSAIRRVFLAPATAVEARVEALLQRSRVEALTMLLFSQMLRQGGRQRAIEGGPHHGKSKLRRPFPDKQCRTGGRKRLDDARRRRFCRYSDAL